MRLRGGQIRRTTGLTVALSVACTKPAPGGPERVDDSSAAGTTSIPTGTSTGTGTSGGESGSTGDATTSSGAPQGSTGAEFECSPDAPPTFDFRLEPAYDDASMLEVDWDCVVKDRVLFALGATLLLDCTDAGVEVEPAPQIVLNASPTVPSLAIEVGDAIRVRYAVSQDVFDHREAVRVEAADQTLLIAGRVNSAGAGPAIAFEPFAGVELEAFDLPCDAEPGAGCGALQHERQVVTIDGASGEVRTGEFIEIGAYGVWAPILAHHVGPFCGFEPVEFDLHFVRLAP